MKCAIGNADTGIITYCICRLRSRVGGAGREARGAERQGMTFSQVTDTLVFKTMTFGWSLGGRGGRRVV